MEKIEKFLDNATKFLEKVRLYTIKITILIIIIAPVIKLFNK